MEVKIQEMGFNPKFSEMGQKSYVLEPSYLHRQGIAEAKSRYMAPVNQYQRKFQSQINDLLG